METRCYIFIYIKMNRRPDNRTSNINSGPARNNGPVLVRGEPSGRFQALAAQSLAQSLGSFPELLLCHFWGGLGGGVGKSKGKRG